MPARHKYRLHQLAIAIALTLGHAGFTSAQQLAFDFEPQHETPAHLISTLDNFINAPDTERLLIKSGQKATDGVSLQLGQTNDLVIVQNRGSFAGVVDGGGGDNILQLDVPKGGKLGESRNFKGLEVKRGDWIRSGPGDFTTGVLIRPKALLTNEGNIHGGAVTEGIFINKGKIGRDVTVLSGGDLTNSGLIAGTVDVQENSHFAGSGVVGGLNVQGHFSVDEVYGAPKVNGDLNLSRSALLSYAVQASGDSPTIVVQGTARLGDATLKLITAGDYPPSSQHTILEAEKVEGRFGSVENNLAFITPTLDYDDPTRVGLTYTRNDVAIEDLAVSNNAREFGESLTEPHNSAPPLTSSASENAETTLPPTADSSPIVAERVATTEITDTVAPPVATPENPVTVAPPVAAAERPVTASPPAPASTTAVGAQKIAATTNAAVTALLATNKATASLALEQLAGSSNANLAKATLSSVDPVSGSMLSAMRQLDSVHGANFLRNAPRQAAGSADNGRVWLQALGHGGKLDRNIEPLQHSTKGLLIGADWSLDEEWRLGVMGGKSRTRLDSRELEGGLDSWHLGAYALRQSGPMSLRLGATYSNHDGNTARRVAFTGFSDRPEGRYDASTQQAFAEVGYNLGRTNVSIEPFASLGVQRYQRDGYTEKGGAAALKVNEQAKTNVNSTLGLRVAKVDILSNGMRLTPRFSAGWKHTYGDVFTKTSQRLATGGRDYTVYGVELDRNSLLVDAGLDLGVSTHHSVGIGLTGEIGTDSRNHGVTGQWRMSF